MGLCHKLAGAQGSSCTVQLIQALIAVYRLLLAISLTNLHIDGGGSVSCGWLGLKKLGTLLIYVGTGDRSQSPNAYCQGACYCKIWQYIHY